MDRLRRVVGHVFRRGGRTADAESFVGRLRDLLDFLEYRDGDPDGNRLLDEGGGLRTAWFSFEGKDWAISYYVDAGDVLLLTVFEITTEETTNRELARAREAMRRSRAIGNQVEDL